MLHIDKLPSIEELRLRAPEEIIKFDDTHFETVGTYLLVFDMIEANKKEIDDPWLDEPWTDEELVSFDCLDEAEPWYEDDYDDD